MNEQSIKNQMEILVEVVRCIQLKRALSEVDPEPPLNFWRLNYGGLMDLAVINWCKIFGSNAEPTHWKGVVDDTQAFRTQLLNYLSIDFGIWEEYWNHMKKYRDEFVAHRLSNSIVDRYPDLEIASNSSYFYYSYLSKLLDDETIPKLNEYSDRFYGQSLEIAKVALNATKDIREKIY